MTSHFETFTLLTNVNPDWLLAEILATIYPELRGDDLNVCVDSTKLFVSHKGIVVGKMEITENQIVIKRIPK